MTPARAACRRLEEASTREQDACVVPCRTRGRGKRVKKKKRGKRVEGESGEERDGWRESESESLNLTSSMLKTYFSMLRRYLWPSWKNFYCCTEIERRGVTKRVSMNNNISLKRVLLL